MNNWIPKNKFVKFAIVVASLSIILYFVGLFLVFSEVKKIEDFYTNTESETSKEQKISAIKSIFDANKESIQTLRNFFIQKGDEVKFIEQIENLAKNSSIKFEIVSIDVREDQTDLLKENVSIKMNIEGPWKNSLFFVDKLRKMSFGVLVENVNLETNIPGKWSGFVSFIIYREK